MSQERTTCPACGGAGGGPFGPAGSVWDSEDYVCTRCKGEGVIAIDPAAPRPGIVKAATPSAERAAETEKRKATG